jgi:hypothetical protein
MESPSALVIMGISQTNLASAGVATWLARRGWAVEVATLSKLSRSEGTPLSKWPSRGAFHSLYGSLSKVKPSHKGSWDLVVGVSLGGTLALSVAANSPNDWARRVVAIDPPLVLNQRQIDAVQQNLLSRFLGQPCEIFRMTWSLIDKTIRLAEIAVTRSRHSRILSELSPFDISSEVSPAGTEVTLALSDPTFFSFVPEKARRELRSRGIPYVEFCGAGHHLLSERTIAIRKLLSSVLSPETPR